MDNWMTTLARHYDRIRARYPDDELVVFFDIDGTILDMRYMILYLLRKYDHEHDSAFFENLALGDIDLHKNQVDRLLERLHLPQPQRQGVLDWYLTNRWSSTAVLTAHRPFVGVMEVIRWFQIQPKTTVALNSGRPAVIREETLRSLNRLGRQYRVSFSDELLFLNSAGWDEGVEQSKVAGLRHYEKAGFRVFAAVDNEPANLTALADADTANEILMLHADTIFETTRTGLPAGTVGGAEFDITELISEKDLPRKVQLVWHGLNDDINIRQYLASEIEWAEFDVRADPEGRLIVRHDSFEETPVAPDEEFLLLEDILKRLKKFDKSAKIDLKEAGDVVDRVLALIDAMDLAPETVWLNSHIEVLGEHGFRKLSTAVPGAVIQCRIDFLAPLIETLPEEGLRVLRGLRGWGINRFSVPWGLSTFTRLIETLDRWKFEVNIYNVPDLESFLQAVLQQPRSVTSDFNFPKWHYYGRGSGQNAQRHEYEERVEDGWRQVGGARGNVHHDSGRDNLDVVCLGHVSPCCRRSRWTGRPLCQDCSAASAK